MILSLGTSCAPKSLVEQRLDLWLDQPQTLLTAKWGKPRMLPNGAAFYALFSRSFQRNLQSGTSGGQIRTSAPEQGKLELSEEDVTASYIQSALQESCLIEFSFRANQTVEDYTYEGKCDPTLIPKPNWPDATASETDFPPN